MKPKRIAPLQKIAHYEKEIAHLQQKIRICEKFLLEATEQGDKDWHTTIIAIARRKIGFYRYLIRKEHQQK